MDKPKLEKFIKQCLTANSIDFPGMAYAVELSWRQDIKPHLQDPWFKEQMEDMLERIRYKLLAKLHEAASEGPKAGKIPPSASHIKEMMKLIDSGQLLWGAKDEPKGEGPEGLTPEEEERLMHRLGLTRHAT